MYPLCGALFRCGCVALWSGAAERCNVHAGHGPHCPWCEHPALGAAGFGLTVAAQSLAFSLARRRGASAAASTAAAVAALPLAVLLAGGATWLVTDYPHFVVEDARQRLGLPPGPIASRALLTDPGSGAGSSPERARDRGAAP